jgi:riboflavin-specific deaminase-like protein
VPVPTGRPFVYTNFAVTLDGRAAIEGRSGPIGTEIDTAMLVALRETCDALMIGAGTLRAERYGRIPPGEGSRAKRQRRGLAADPLVVVISGTLDVPWDSGLFTDGGGRVLIVTTSEEEIPETATPVDVMRMPRGDVEPGRPARIDLAAVMGRLRADHGVRSVLSEGGPRLHGTLIEDDLVDELFVTIAPVISGGEGPRMTELLSQSRRALELLWLLEAEGELFARYRLRR